MGAEVLRQREELEKKDQESGEEGRSNERPSSGNCATTFAALATQAGRQDILEQLPDTTDGTRA